MICSAHNAQPLCVIPGEFENGMSLSRRDKPNRVIYLAINPLLTSVSLHQLLSLEFL